MDDFDQPSIPPEDADIERLVRQYRPTEAARDTGTSPEHVAEAWHDAIDDALDDALDRELTGDRR